MIPATTLSLDDEGYRLLALYEASSAKQVAATRQLLYPSHRLLHPEYMTLLGDLRIARTECDDRRLAMEAHWTTKRGLDSA